MKKLIFLFAALVTFSNLRAESIITEYYNVVSDEFDAKNKPGTCLLKGKLVDINGGVIAGGLVSNLNRSSFAVSDAKGNYSMTLSSKDTAIFFYHEEYGEIVIWKFEFKSQHTVVIDFYSLKAENYPAMAEKPVIYLYSPEETYVNLTLHHPQFIFTYPQYNNGWSVKTNAGGGLTDLASGKNYPYIFWEGTSENLNFVSEGDVISGFMINTDSVVSFLESALTTMGLNATEQTDFITYWAPRMINQPYAFVQFLVDEQYDAEIAGLTVTPTPDSQRRICMLFKPLDQPHVLFDYETQTLPAFERSGFTLIEWGGSELSNPTFIP